MSAAPSTLLPVWTAEQKALQKSSIVTFNHRLRETGLFEDEALAALIDAQPRDALDVCTMKRNPPPGETWHAGKADDLDGAALVQAVKTGALWVSCRNGMVRHPAYKKVFDQMMGEYAAQTGDRILSADASILISAPQMGIFFHVDTSETMLWHVRGTKTMYVYPSVESVLPEMALEAIFLKETLSDAPYRAEMEALATPVTLHEGQALKWPLHGPHRVVNGNDLNVSVSIEYATPKSALLAGTYYVNGRLRRAAGLNPSSRRTPAVAQPAYALAAKALKTVAPTRNNVERKHAKSFDVDLSAPDCLVWREGFGPRAEPLSHAA